MYKPNKIRTKYGVSPLPSVPVEEFECDHSYKPLSYYLLGGSDPTGEHTDLSATTYGEDAEYLASGEMLPDALCDVRTSNFDLFEQAGYEEAMAAAESAAQGKKEKN